MTSLYLSLTCHDKYTSPSWSSSSRSIVPCDLLSLSRYELLYNIHFDAAHHDQKYRKLWRLCIFICVDMTNTPNTFRPSSSRSKVWDVWTSLYFSLSWHDKYTKYISIKLIKIKSIRCCDVRVSRAHCWNSEGKLLSTNTNAADHSLLFFPQDLNTPSSASASK